MSNSFSNYYIKLQKKHTHPFNSPLLRTTWVNWYQKVQTNLDITEARDSERQWHQLGHMQVCTLLQTDNQTSTPPLCLQARCPSCRPTNSVKALKGRIRQITMPAPHHSVFMGQMPFLPPNQQCQSTEGKHKNIKSINYFSAVIWYSCLGRDSTRWIENAP